MRSGIDPLFMTQHPNQPSMRFLKEMGVRRESCLCHPGQEITPAPPRDDNPGTTSQLYQAQYADQGCEGINVRKQHFAHLNFEFENL